MLSASPLLTSTKEVMFLVAFVCLSVLLLAGYLLLTDFEGTWQAGRLDMI